LAAAGVGVALLAGCSDHGVTSPDSQSAPRLLVAPGDVCETISFNGFAHGADITSLSALGLSLGVSGSRFVDPSGAFGGAISPKAFNTSNQAVLEDDDLQAPPQGDCTACAGLNSIMVLPDERGFDPWGDYRWGGTMTIGGFSGGSFYVTSFKAIDDDTGEPAIGLFLDGAGAPVAASTGLGDATVETVTVPSASTHTFTTSITFRLGTPAQDAVTGSGGVDDVRICKVTPPPPSNPGTLTQGFWKNHPDAWPVTSITIGGTSYTVAQAIAIMQTPVKGDITVSLFHQLVAAKLNVLAGNDDSCIASDIAAADAFLTAHPVGSGVSPGSAAGQSIVGTLTRLDSYNNGQLCVPHAP
jgi:hypothetical protein